MARRKMPALTVTALVVVLVFVVLALFGTYLTPYDPLMTNMTRALQPPSFQHWFGTDNLGRDIFSRVIAAAGIDLYIAVLAVSLAFLLGVSVGALAGYYGGRLDRAVSRLVDTIMAFPLFVLAMGIVAALGNTLDNIILATALINIPFYIRMTRAEFLVQKGMEYVDAARISGASSTRIMARHIFPNVLPVLVVQASLNLGWTILNASGLSFIGLGVRPPTPEWGILVAEGATYMVSGQWWISLFPGLALMIVVLAFNLLGDGLRDLVDSKSRT